MKQYTFLIAFALCSAIFLTACQASEEQKETVTETVTKSDSIEIYQLTEEQKEILTNLSNDINEEYGFIDGDSRINRGPCGRFANNFYNEWNKKYKYKIIISFVMALDGEECHHVMVKLPNGDYYDGGNGIMTQSEIDEELDGIGYMDDMVDYSFERLDAMSYSLKRTYPACPNYSDATTLNIINKHLGLIPAGLKLDTTVVAPTKGYQPLLDIIGEETVKKYLGHYVFQKEDGEHSVYISTKGKNLALNDGDSYTQHGFFPNDSINFKETYLGDIQFQFSSEGDVTSFTATIQDEVHTYNKMNIPEGELVLPDLETEYTWVKGENCKFLYNNGILSVDWGSEGIYVLIPASEEVYIFANWPRYKIKFSIDASKNRLIPIEYIEEGDVSPMSVAN